jgi:uncharacterized protein YndB with AHSA1/START domain
MSMDIASYLGTVTRVVHDRTRDGEPVKVVSAARTYDTSVDDLWNAITTPDRIARWFSPVSGDLRLGGRYQITGNAGGTITACEPPRHVALTWEFAGATSWVAITLTARGAGAHLLLEHTLRPDDHWTKFGAGATGVGWDLTLYGLDRHIASAGSTSVADGLAWMTSPEGKSFMRAASDGWRDAAIAGGAPVTDATEQAARTAGFYTGELA